MRGTEYIELSIKSFESLLQRRRSAAIEAMNERAYTVAQIALADCIAYEAVIDELKHQLEAMEV